MMHLRQFLGAAALVCGTSLIAGWGPSSVGAQSPNSGLVTVTVVLTGDAGGDVGQIILTINDPSGSQVAQQPAAVGGTVFSLPFGAYDLVATVSDPAYVITGLSCTSQSGSGPGQGGPDFVIDGNGQGDFVPASCTVTATYTAPVTTPPTTPPSTPPTTAPPTSVPPATEPPASTAPGTPTTDATGALAPGAVASGAGTASGTIPVTGPSDQTLPIALTALGMLLLGSGAVVVARRR